jgi:hypothetical protein
MIRSIVYQAITLLIYLSLFTILFQYRNKNELVISIGFKYIFIVFITLLLIISIVNIIKGTKISFAFLFKKLLISAIITTIFYTNVILIMERSLSVHLLNQVSDESKNVNPQNVEEQIFDSWQNGDFQIVKRLDEQIAIGNIEFTKDGRFELTVKGNLINKIVQGLQTIFKLN